MRNQNLGFSEKLRTKYWIASATLNSMTTHALSMSAILICTCMSSMDEVSPSMDDIHRWHFHPWMRFLHPWTTSTDKVPPSMDEVVIFQIFLMCYKVLNTISAKVGNLCEQNVIDDNYTHGWKNHIHGWKCFLWISSLDEETSSMEGSIIPECPPWMENPHLWMTSTYEDDRWQTWTEQMYYTISSICDTFLHKLIKLRER